MTDPAPPPLGNAGDDALVVSPSLTIPRAELQFRASKAGGPGGQHVNTSSTRVEVVWSPARSAALDDGQRAVLLEKLGRRLDGEGYVRVVASDSRSQRQNRERAEERLAALVRDALTPRKRRRPTKRPRRANEARLDEKKRRGERKRDRRGDF
jgi:ribosome-associated protein